jgi:hypothetical protein
MSNLSNVTSLEQLERDYKQREARIWANESLSWEKRNLETLQLGIAYDRRHKELAMEAASQRASEEAPALRCSYFVVGGHRGSERALSYKSGETARA